MTWPLTYSTSTRLALVVHELHTRRAPWLLSDIAVDLGVCSRTVQRYARVLVEAGIVERCGVAYEPAIRIRIRIRRTT